MLGMLANKGRAAAFALPQVLRARATIGIILFMAPDIYPKRVARHMRYAGPMLLRRNFLSFLLAMNLG